MIRMLAVLRPEPGNAATAMRIAAMGLTALRLPLFAIRPLAWTPPDPDGFDALLLTSVNAVRHAGEGLDRVRDLPVIAVGEATARAARAAGLRVETVGMADAAAAVAASRRRHPLHLAGREHVRVGATTIAVYAADELPVTDAGVLGGAVVLLHSARAARRLVLLAARDRVADLQVAAISDAVRAAGPDVPGSVAAHPHDDALVACAARLAAD